MSIVVMYVWWVIVLVCFGCGWLGGIVLVWCWLVGGILR